MKKTKEGIVISSKAYELMKKNDDGTYTVPDYKEELTAEQKEIITVYIKSGRSKPKILAELKISGKLFNSFLKERFGTIKLTEIREKLGGVKNLYYIVFFLFLYAFCLRSPYIRT